MLRRTTQAPLFREVNLELTILCNLRCPFCWWWGTSGVAPTIIRERQPLWKDQLSRAEIARTFEPLRGKPVHVYLSGGEPFERDDTIDIIETLSSFGLTISLTTNATLLTEAVVARLVKVSGLTVVHVSVDGPKEIHDSIRGSGSFERTLENARSLVRRRNESRRPQIWSNTVMTRDLIGRTQDLMGSIRQTGFDRAVVQHLWFADRATLDRHREELKNDFGVEDSAAEGHLMSRPGPEYGQAVAEELEATRRLVYPFPMWVSPHLSVAQARRYYSDMSFSVVPACAKPWTGVNVKADGSVNFCPDQWISYAVGNVREAPLLSLWNNSASRLFRQKLNTRGLYPGCVHCCAINWRQQ